MLKLFFDLKHQNITLTNPGVTVASDSKNYLVAKFNTISDDWETPLSAIFVSTVDKIAYTVLVGQSSNLEPDECFVPWEVLKDSGDVYVSVFSGNLHTTNTAKFAVVKSGYIEGEIPPPPTPTVYEQILEELENKQDVIHLDNVIDEVYNPNGHYVLYYFDTQEIRHNIFDFDVFQELAEEKIYEILDYTLQGDPNIAPSLYIEANQGGSYSLVYMDSDDQKHVIFDFSNLPLGTSDYDDLSNRPQINGHTLTGNQSADDLGLQGKLTAGENITIENDGTISAGGGVTSYNDLTDLPQIYYRFAQGSSVSTDFKGSLSGSGAVYFLRIRNTNSFTINLDETQVFLVKRVATYDLNNYYSSAPFFLATAANRFSNLPSFVSAKYDTQVGLLNLAGKDTSAQMQLLFWQDSDNNSHYAARVLNSPWIEIGSGGAQIVSAVVNQNGTITFTDSDGETFNTSGNNIVTSGDQQISMGFDNNGKFYFRFDDGQGE